ncbi:DUF305 domain-containing protein [Amycolatopsis minnesotensis]|uniref:DUF305 domain-containing protein n=1 Tax=Amycolatopsis minnesotensis TaxID=337894 RepID=A0ABP5D2H1_9PSEU
MIRKSLVGAVLAALALSGCAGTAPQDDTKAAPSQRAGTAHNDADVTFARQMVPHHTQALDMAALVPDRTANPAVTDLAARIKRAQGPEIEQLDGWLARWGAAPSGGHAMPGMPSHASMGGMMSDAEMTKLRAGKGAEFDRMWLTMMIGHHEGAVEMANAELRGGADADAKALAGRIAGAQRAEIAEMRKLLGGR